MKIGKVGARSPVNLGPGNDPEPGPIPTAPLRLDGINSYLPNPGDPAFGPGGRYHVCAQGLAARRRSALQMKINENAIEACAVHVLVPGEVPPNGTCTKYTRRQSMGAQQAVTLDVRLSRFFSRWHRVNRLVLWGMVAGLAVAKALGAIGTPWLVVLAPVWGGTALALAWLAVAAAIFLLLCLLGLLIRMLP